MEILVGCDGEKTKPNKANLYSFSVRRSEFRVKIKESSLKKQSQFARILYRVLRIAKDNLKKQSQF
jgi:hypothetical protein